MTEYGDIQLNGKPYRIELESYRGVDIVDFAPRAATPGGSIIHSELGLYQPLLMSDWRHGFGFHWFSDAMGYMRTVGNVDTRHPDVAMLFTKTNSSETEDFQRIGAVLHNGKLYTYGPGGIRRFVDGAWSDVSIFQPTVHTSTSGKSTTSQTSLTISHEVTEDGADRGLLVFVGVQDDVDITGVTWNGVALTQKATIGTAPKARAFFLADPETGTHNVVISTGAGTTIGGIVHTLLYVNQSDPFGTIASDTDTSSETASVAATSDFEQLVVDFMVKDYHSGEDTTIGAGQTLLEDEEDIEDDISIYSSKENGSASVTMSWTWTNDVDSSILAVPIKPSETTNIISMLSNGDYLFACPANGRLRRTQKDRILTIQPSEAELQDTSINEADSDENYDDKSVGRVGTVAATKHRSILLKFDLSALPSDADIQSVKLYLTRKKLEGDMFTINIHRILPANAQWAEKTATWDTKDGTAAWAGSNGCRTSGTDYSATALYSDIPSDTKKNLPVEFDLNVTEFEAMVAANHGMIVFDTLSESNRWVNFSLSRDEEEAMWPKLEIEYETSGGWEDAGVDSEAGDYNWMMIHNGYVYAGKNGENRVHKASDVDLTDFEGSEDDADAITVGIGGVSTVNAVSFNSNLYIARADGLWQLGEDGIARKVLNFESEVSPRNFKSIVVHNGYVIFPIRDTIRQWNGVRLSDITPNKINDSFPYTTYGNFSNFVIVGNWLYCTARTNEETYTESLLCYDGIGWFKLTDLVTDGLESVSLLYFDSELQRMWYHINGEDQDIRYIQFNDISPYPYEDFPTTGTHSLISSRLDMGFRRVKKSTPSILISGSNLSDDTYLSVYYSLDGGEWVLWDKIKETGMTTLTHPNQLDTIEYNYIQIRVDFVTTDSEQSPILEDITLRFIMRPEVSFGTSFNIVAASGRIYENTMRNIPVSQIISDLKQARNSKAPVDFVDIYGDKYKVYISSYQERAVARHIKNMPGGKPDVEQIVSVNVVDVTETYE